jgi:putative ABC transport system permease protein
MIRHTLRGLWRSKGFTAVAILCLGFGIGVNTTIFSVMDGVLLKPYPYPDPDRIVILQTQNRKEQVDASVSFLDLRDWKAANSSFVQIAAVAGRSVTITSPGADPERYSAAGVTWDLFPLLGTHPIRGQHFTEEQDRVGGAAVVLLSHDLWARRYLSDEAIVGKTLVINGRPHEVVGVMPPRFGFPNNQKLWLPLAQQAGNDTRENRYLFTFARLKPGVTVSQATQNLDAIAVQLAEQYPSTNDGWTNTRLRTLREEFLPPEVPIVIALMMVGATLVLAIACSNVANLLLARATARRREISVRTALGAGRGRIVRQLLTESLVLGALSLPLGIALAQVGTRLISGAMPPEQVPYYITWDMDWRSLAYSAVIAIGTAALFGLFPALQASRGNLHDSLKEGTRGNSASRSKLRSSLVVAQVSLALVCLVGALLFVRTFRNLDLADVGFDTRPLMSMRMYLAGDAYDNVTDARLRRVEDVLTRLETAGGVQAAFSSNFIPLAGGGGGGPVVIDGRPPDPGGQPGINLIGVTPGFARTMGFTIVRGRDFTRSEGFSKQTLALVNERMARRFWKDPDDAVGRRFRVQCCNAGNDWFTVIGVVPDANLYGIQPENTEPPTVAYVPYAWQQLMSAGLTIRVTGEPSAITPVARAALRESDPNVPLSLIRTAEESRRLGYWQFGLYGWIFGTIGIVGLLLASVGVYGVLSYSVTQRTQEIGVRVALGADRRDVVKLVVKYGLLLGGIGVGIGLVLAPVMTYFAQSLFFNVSPFDPVTFGAVALFLLAVAFLASYLPARRATRVNPVIALRGE